MAGKASKQELALAALLSERTVEQAAAKAGISYRTLKNWLRDPTFSDAYRRARAEVLERTVARLLTTCGDAVEALRKNLTCGKAGPEIRAAVAILTHAVRGVETLDLRAEVDELKRQIEAMRQGSSEHGSRERPPGTGATEGAIEGDASASDGEFDDTPEPDVGP
jgi:hypothetical protein